MDVSKNCSWKNNSKFFMESQQNQDQQATNTSKQRKRNRMSNMPHPVIYSGILRWIPESLQDPKLLILLFSFWASCAAIYSGLYFLIFVEWDDYRYEIQYFSPILNRYFYDGAFALFLVVLAIGLVIQIDSRKKLRAEFLESVGLE